jgi:hypothetical protein
LRDLLRYRRKLVESRGAERNRLLKLLETANIKLSSVATDVFGASGQLMLEALREGVQTPQQMAELAKGRLREKIPQLQLALEGRLEDPHRFLLRLQRRRLQQGEADLAELEKHLSDKLQPYAFPAPPTHGNPGRGPHRGRHPPCRVGRRHEGLRQRPAGGLLDRHLPGQ